MTIQIFRGDAVAVAQATKITPRTVLAGHVYSLQINGKRVSVTAETTDVSDLVAAFVDALSASTIPEFQEMVADDHETYFTLTSNVAGTPFEISSLSGDFATDEYQVITLNHSPTGGTFTLTWRYLDALGVLQTETTSTIAYNASAATVQSALEALAHIGSGNVIVAGSNGGPYTCHFTGTLSRQDVYALTPDGSSLTGGDAVLTVSTIQAAVAGTSEVQTITLYGSPSGGTFTLTFRNATTTALAYNASTATVQAALRALATIGGSNVTVSGSAGAWVVTFAADLAHQNVDMISIDATNLTGGTIYATAATTTQGVASVNQVFYLSHVTRADTQAHIYIDKTTFTSWASGSWTITINGNTSSSIAYNATDPQIAAIIETLLGSSGVLVSSSNTQIIIGFCGPLFPVTLSSVSVTSLISGGSVSVSSYSSGTNAGSTGQSSNFKFNSLTELSAELTPYATAAEVQTALENMAAIGAGNVLVTDLEGSMINDQGLYRIELKGAKAATTVDLHAFDVTTDPLSYMTLDVYQWPVASGSNEVQTITLSGSPAQGSMVLSYGAEATAALPYNSTAADVQAAIIGLNAFAVGDVVVSLAGGVFTLRFGGNYSYTNVPQITVNDSYLKASVVETTPGVTGKNEIQRLSIAGQAVWGGTLTLTFGANTTSALAYNLTALAAHTALEGLASLGAGTITATRGPFPENPIELEFTGSKAETDVAAISGTTTSLKNATVTLSNYDPLTIDGVTLATGPNHWNDPTNWNTGRVPEWGDTVIFSEGDSDILYGLRQVSAFTVDAANDYVIPAGVDLIVGQKVRAWSTGTLPAGMSTGTDYYVISIDSVTRYMRLSTSSGGATINITGSGSGTHYIGVRLSAVSPLPCLYTDARYTGSIGLPQRNDNDYWEYRPRYLTIGIDPAGSQLVIIGQGDGSASGLIRLNTSIDQVNLEVLNSAGSTETGVPPVSWVGVNSANVITVYNGDLGIAYYADEVSTINRLNVRAGTATLGNVLFAGTAPMLDRTSGEVKTKDQVTLSGVLRLRG